MSEENISNDVDREVDEWTERWIEREKGRGEETEENRGREMHWM